VDNATCGAAARVFVYLSESVAIGKGSINKNKCLNRTRNCAGQISLLMRCSNIDGQTSTLPHSCH
jgi:hypothetical protein